MIVRIAEIKALAVCRPVHFAFDRDTAGDQMLFPRAEVFLRHSERDVHLARGTMRRNHSAGRGDRFQSFAAAEQEEHLFVRDAEHAEPLAGFEQAQSELVPIEANGSWKIARVKASLNDAVYAQGGQACFSGQAEREIPGGVHPAPFRDRNGTFPDLAVAGRLFAARFSYKWPVQNRTKIISMITLT